MRLLLLICTFFITFSYVAAFFKPPFFADFFRGLSGYREPSDEYNRVLKLIEDIAKTQVETNKQLVMTQKQIAETQAETQKLIAETNKQIAETNKQLAETDKQLAKTDKQLRLLINYNSNRDEELEMFIEEAMVRKLKDAEWTVSVAEFTEIFRSDGRKLLEWDGILMCRHEKSQKDVLVVIETKQIVTMEKFEKFKTRFLKMKKAMKNTVVDDDLWPFRDFLLCGVIAGPVIKEEEDISGFTFILKEDQYEVNLEPLIFNSTAQ